MIILNDPKFARSQLKAAHEHKTLTHKLLLLIKDLNHFNEMDLKSLDLDTLSSSSVRTLQIPFRKEHEREMNLSEIIDAIRLGSSNGIVFLALKTVDSDKFCMWNPSIQFLKVLPELDLSPGKRISYFGVGYLPATGDYKLVLNHGDKVCSEDYSTYIAMFSTRNNAWKWLQVHHVDRFFSTKMGTLSNEALHWVSRKDHVIVAADLADESSKCREMSLPKFADEDGDVRRCFNHLGVSAGGCLRLARFSRTGLKVWEMKEYNVSCSWTKLLN